MENFQQQLDQFIFRVQDMMNKAITLFCPEIKAEPGKKYVRIVRFKEHDGQITEHSAYCFVDVQTGDIFKPANFKTPAKHARGNISDQFGGMSWLTPYGVGSLK